jgi:subtilisin family serine protease
VSTVETAFSFLSNYLGLYIEALEVDFYISPSDGPTSLVTSVTPLPLKGGYRWNLRQIALDEVHWQVQGQGVHVAVLDTGIDASHPLLAGRIGNSYNARIYEANKADYMDRNGHGTHVAGIIAAAAGAPGSPEVIRGIAPGVTLHAVRILDETGGGYLTDLISGLVWVYQQPHIRVVNMSLGSTNGSRVVEKIIKKLYDAGVVLVASAGNCNVTATSGTGGDGEGGDGEGGDGEGGDSATSSQGCPQQEMRYPAAYWRTIAVGATDVDARVTYYSMMGSYVDVVAPGGTRQTGQVVSTNTTVSAGTASATTSGLST